MGLLKNTKTVVRVGYVYGNEWTACGRGPTVQAARKNLEEFLFARALEQTVKMYVGQKPLPSRESMVTTLNTILENEKSYRYIEQEPIEELDEE